MIPPIIARPNDHSAAELHVITAASQDSHLARRLLVVALNRNGHCRTEAAKQ